MYADAPITEDDDENAVKKDQKTIAGHPLPKRRNVVSTWKFRSGVSVAEK